MVSPIYTLWTISKVTGTNIDFELSHTFWLEAQTMSVLDEILHAASGT